jgi:hypothetical protein
LAMVQLQLQSRWFDYSHQPRWYNFCTSPDGTFATTNPPMNNYSLQPRWFRCNLCFDGSATATSSDGATTASQRWFRLQPPTPMVRCNHQLMVLLATNPMVN